MQRERLTPDRIRRFECQPELKQAFLWDTEAPRLAVRATPGSKSFIFESKLERQTIRRTIGDVRAWVLDDARMEARRLQTLVDQGVDPRELDREKAEEKARAKAAKEAAREAERIEAERRKNYTLQALCNAYVNHLRSKGKTKSATDSKSAFRVHVVEAWPDVAALPAREVSSRQIAAIIRKVRESGKERTAGILRNYLTAAYNAARRAPFDSAMSSDMIQFEIESNPSEIVPAIPVNRGDRALNADELKTYMAELNDDAVGQFLRVALYTGGQRMAQLARAKVSDFDPETGTLRLLDPKGKRLKVREHFLPLGPKAITIARRLVAQQKTADAKLFGASDRKAGDRISEISASMDGEPFNARDIRRTCETMLAGLGITKDIRGQLLSHGISGVQASHYDRHEYIDEKRNALNAWEERLEEIATGRKADSNVVPIQGKSAT